MYLSDFSILIINLYKNKRKYMTNFYVPARVRIQGLGDVHADKEILYAAGVPMGRALYRVFQENGNRGYVGPWWFDPERALDLAATDPERFTVYREIVGNGH